MQMSTGGQYCRIMKTSRLLVCPNKNVGQVSVTFSHHNIYSQVYLAKIQLTELGDTIVNNTRKLKVGFYDTLTDKQFYLAATSDGTVSTTEVSMTLAGWKLTSQLASYHMHN